MPTQPEIELPLLKILASHGGKVTPDQVYESINTQFPQLTETDLEELVSGGANKWRNRIRWVRQRLISKGELSSPEFGVWAITPKGIERLKSSTDSKSSKTPEKKSEQYSANAPNLEELAEAYLSAFKQKLIQNLMEFTPAKFEHFCGALLKGYGFTNVTVTGKTNDGGIDGHGKLKVGLATMHVAFQCKRWQGNVQRKQIDEFRGDTQGKFEQGYFFTTSDFATGAKNVSIQKGAVTIVLINGEAIAQLMIDKGIGVSRRPVELYEDRVDSIFDIET